MQQFSPSDTFFTASPDWTIYIVPYFFVGGIAGGAYFLSALLHWRGAPEDERIVRAGYIIAAIGAVLSGILLTLDLGRPLRFWHMLFQSERFPLPILKPWSPMSVGSWVLLLFGACATLSALGVLATRGWRLAKPFRVFYEGLPGRILAVFGACCGLFIAGYTGVLLSVTNRPVWADSPFVGLLFLLSGVSTAAATLILLSPGRTRAHERDHSILWLARFDGRTLLLELLVLILFLWSLGQVATVWLSAWGVALLLLVIVAGILIPLVLHVRPTSFSDYWRKRSIVIGAILVLVGGLCLRIIVLGVSDVIGPPVGFGR